MYNKKPPPPDHLVPLAWLEKSGVTQEELANWTSAGLTTKVVIHGGAEFYSFKAHQKPVKFGEVSKLVIQTRKQYA